MQGSYLNGYNQMKQYIVKSGDSLYSIAKTFNTTVDELKSINHLYSNTIYPNQILFIPNSSKTNNTYLTNSGDSLKDIMKKFDLDISDLEKFNDLDKLKLEANQLLLVEKRSLDSVYIAKNGDKIEEVLSKFNLSPLEFLKLNESKILNNGNEIIIGK